MTDDSKKTDEAKTQDSSKIDVDRSRTAIRILENLFEQMLDDAIPIGPKNKWYIVLSLSLGEVIVGTTPCAWPREGLVTRICMKPLQILEWKFQELLEDIKTSLEAKMVTGTWQS